MRRRQATIEQHQAMAGHNAAAVIPAISAVAARLAAEIDHGRDAKA